MMQVTQHPAVSGYRIEMESCLVTWKGGGNTTITQEQLCECMGVKVTVCFRRHISEMQTDGMVTRFKYRTEKGGYKVAYLIH